MSLASEPTLFAHAAAKRVPQLSRAQMRALRQVAAGKVLYRVAGGWEVGRFGPRLDLRTVSALVGHRLLAGCVDQNRSAMKITPAGRILADRHTQRRQS